MIKQGTVKQAKYLGRTWEAHNKTFYVHGIAFENGDFGEYSSVSDQQNKFAVGLEVRYEITGEPGKVKIKPVHDLPEGGTPFNTPSAFKEAPKDKNRGFALSYAKDFICAQIATGSKELGPADVLLIAEDFNNWLNNDQDPQSRPAKPDPDLPSNPIPSDDLPF